MENDKILIVEDNVDLMEAYEIIFKKNGFAVVTAYDGVEAEKRLRLFKPDVILLDIMMPKMNGFSFLEKIRKSFSDTKIILNSNLSQDSDIARGFALGADEYFRKSDFTPAQLVEKVDKILLNKVSN